MTKRDTGQPLNYTRQAISRIKMRVKCLVLRSVIFDILLVFPQFLHQYKTHIKGQNLNIPNPFNPYVYSDIVSKESALRSS